MSDITTDTPVLITPQNIEKVADQLREKFSSKICTLVTINGTEVPKIMENQVLFNGGIRVSTPGDVPQQTNSCLLSMVFNRNAIHVRTNDDPLIQVGENHVMFTSRESRTIVVAQR